MNSRFAFRSVREFLALAVFWLAPVALVADQPEDKGPVQTGYVIVTPGAENTEGLVVFETFGKRKGSDTQQAGVLPSSLTTHAVLFVSTSGRLSRNIGAAIVNPASVDATVVLELLDDAGTPLASKSLTLPAKSQVSAFITELFANTPAMPSDLTGTLHISGEEPFGVVGLRFRGENFSTIPATNLDGPFEVPLVSDAVGGPGSALLAHFAAGGGWGTELVLANAGTAKLVVRVDLFKPDGTPLAASLNGKTQSSFEAIEIPAGGVVVLAQRNSLGDSDF